MGGFLHIQGNGHIFQRVHGHLHRVGGHSFPGGDGDFFRAAKGHVLFAEGLQRLGKGFVSPAHGYGVNGQGTGAEFIAEGKANLAAGNGGLQSGAESQIFQPCFTGEKIQMKHFFQIEFHRAGAPCTHPAVLRQGFGLCLGTNQAHAHQHNHQKNGQYAPTGHFHTISLLE